MSLMVECNDLDVGWKGKDPLLEGFSITIDFDILNYTLPIVGRTGRGKSTLLYALAGMAKPTHGKISWRFPDDPQPWTWSADNEKSFGALARLRRRRFGFLLQDASMIPCFTVAENLRHLLRIRGIKGDLDVLAKKALEKMLIKEQENAEQILRQYPVTLSGGQRQRIALAAAVVHEPTVLFADEPTASLDAVTGMQILNAMRAWLDEDGAKGKRAVVFVTHWEEKLNEGMGARLKLSLDEQGEDDLRIAKMQPVKREPLARVG